jgi:hypothetical protein
MPSRVGTRPNLGSGIADYKNIRLEFIGSILLRASSRGTVRWR